ncbi:Metallo-dependent phosphatase-like [Sesbania bispinosa]|nr:Metallo-dependent phosphatase-like [Sesbania bispinosa]
MGNKLDIDFVVSTGDNFYGNGIKGVNDPAFLESFSNIYTAKSLQKQWYSDTTPFINDYYKDSKHTYDWRGVSPRHIYLKNLLKDFKAALVKSNARWKIVVGHHAIRSIGHHGDTPELVKHLIPILKANNVDIYMNGHDHCLQHICSKDSPLQYLTSGAGSKAWRGDVKESHSDYVKFFYDGQGFMSVQMTEIDAKFAFYNVYGENIHHWKVSKSRSMHSSA